MKNQFIKYYIFLLVPFLAACDCIDNPILSSGNDYREDLYGPVPVFPPLPENERYKRVVVEDFTGHHCGNCPPAHIVASDILEEFGEEKISVVAVHCTGLADPSETPFEADYTTTEGDQYWEPFEGFGIPLGRINRSGGIDNPWTPAQWTTETQNQLVQLPLAVMQIRKVFEPGSNHLSVHVHTEYTEPMDGSQNLVLLVLESQIYSAQLWYGNDPEIIAGYEHNHMLRAALTGPWGLLNTTDPSDGTTIIKSYTFDWNTSWNADNCSVLAFLVNNDTGEIINSVEAEIIE